MRMKRIDRLRGILSCFPESVDTNRIILLPAIGPVLHDLGQAGFIDLNIQPGWGNNDGSPDISDINDRKIKAEGAEINISPKKSDCTKWQWELIKRAVARIGFRFAGRGQADWWLRLEP